MLCFLRTTLHFAGMPLPCAAQVQTPTSSVVVLGTWVPFELLLQLLLRRNKQLSTNDNEVVCISAVCDILILPVNVVMSITLIGPVKTQEHELLERDLLVVQKISYIEIISTVVLLAIVVESSRVFHVVG